MTEFEKKALEQIAIMSDPDSLRQMIVNARGKSEIVEKAAFRRLVSIASKHETGTVQHDCWAMVYTIEELRRIGGRTVSRMNRMRPKIEKEGEIGALEYCAIKRTDGFDEIIAYGMPELTAEAIVLRHKDHFSEKALSAAIARLRSAGVEVDHSGKIVNRV